MIINEIKLPDRAMVLGTEYKIFYETKESNPKMSECFEKAGISGVRK